MHLIYPLWTKPFKPPGYKSAEPEVRAALTLLHRAVVSAINHYGREAPWIITDSLGHTLITDYLDFPPVKITTELDFIDDLVPVEATVYPKLYACSLMEEPFFCIAPEAMLNAPLSPELEKADIIVGKLTHTVFTNMLNPLGMPPPDRPVEYCPSKYTIALKLLAAMPYIPPNIKKELPYLISIPQLGFFGGKDVAKIHECCEDAKALIDHPDNCQFIQSLKTEGADLYALNTVLEEVTVGASLRRYEGVVEARVPSINPPQNFRQKLTETQESDKINIGDSLIPQENLYLLAAQEVDAHQQQQPKFKESLDTLMLQLASISRYSF